MLTFNQVALSIGAQTLIENINFSVYPKQVIGIIGDNGCGKSSLFAMIQAYLEPAQGRIEWQNNITIAALEQEVKALECSVLEHVLASDENFFEIYQRLMRAQQENDGINIALAYNDLSDIDGYSRESEAATILHGLGFTNAQIALPISEFSGAWRMRASLARALFAPGDILLLDEPNNHLDMEGIIWLEKFIKQYPGAILMISHDQALLDNTVTDIMHISQNSWHHYHGNYSNFQMQRAQNIQHQQAQYQKQQKTMKHYQQFIDRFGSKATKAKQARSRKKALEKMEQVAPFFLEKTMSFSFLKPEAMPRPMLKVEHATFAYQDPVLEGVSCVIYPGDRIGILGLNGAGKSTFIKGLCGTLAPQKGLVERYPGLKIAYFAQHQVDTLDLDSSPIALMCHLNPSISYKVALAHLASFGFNKDLSERCIAVLSGGEKARLALALMVFQRPNLLLLDEPSNHLDLNMRQALSYALLEFSGALVVISHDRHLLSTLVDTLYLVEDQKVQIFPGSVMDY